MTDTRKLLVSAFQQQGNGGAILNVRGVHVRSKNEATSIDQNVAFAAIDAFGAVVPADAADARGSNRLAVDDASARLRVAADTDAKLLSQERVEVLPRAIQAVESWLVAAGDTESELLPDCRSARRPDPGGVPLCTIDGCVNYLVAAVQV